MLIHNEDCNKTLDRYAEDGVTIDVVLTSPPYNNSRTCHSEYSMKSLNCRYDSYNDNMTNDEYSKWTCGIFNRIDKVLAKNGVVLYNISYGTENVECMWTTMSDIIRNTNFTIADCIIWKKKSALPNNVSANKLTRITEFVFVLCRKDEFDTFFMNRKVKSTSRTGQKYYESVFNFIVADNNDGVCELNNATYSTDLCKQLLNLYATTESFVYDPFMGSGTTAAACKQLGIDKCEGSEISQKQVEYAYNRLNNTAKDTKVIMEESDLFC